ncbi:hypothetical protein [Planobispora longispora]|uniref:MFS transporter n=1 Tax=Planobispora longispora TaxID=28887 RepID=A0A8J3RL46_9ACTN|nr:hypothetical protein [Planobispora longispora]GIH74293.1 hypothetical protein Plo01_07220 [Planobispora longispora]
MTEVRGDAGTGVRAPGGVLSDRSGRRKPYVIFSAAVTGVAGALAVQLARSVR